MSAPTTAAEEQTPRGVPFMTAAGADAESATTRGSVSRLYRQYCAEEGCRVNSAFMEYIAVRGDVCSLTSLSLRDNYVGPRGLRPVIRLIADCQTLMRVDLSGNGATNDTVDYLCSVAERHLSLSAIGLRDNPITVVGAKRLLEMLEANQRIVEVDLAGSDVLGAMQERIRYAAELNRLRAEHVTPQLIAATLHCEARADGISEEESRNRAEAYSYKQQHAAKLQPLTHENTRSIAAGVAAAPASYALTPSTATTGQAKGKTAESKPTTMRAPAAVAAGSVRLPAAQLRAIKAKYADRTRLFAAIDGSAASRAAYEARAELAAMEANTATVQPSLVSGEPVPDVADVAPSGGIGVDADDADIGLTDSRREAAAAPECVDADDDAQEEGEGTEADARAGEYAEDADLEDVPGVAEGGEGNAVARANAGEGAPLPSSDRDDEDDGSQRCTDADAQGARALTVEDASIRGSDRGGGALRLSKEEHFQLLFDEGCREYSHKNLDGAYVAWQEALKMATERHNREWIAVVSSNLQRLSYELLVNEGVEQLNRDELQEATKSFTYALDIAVKAHNAAWESAMQKALKEAKSAVFHRSHESAMRLFEKAVELKRQQRERRPSGGGGRRGGGDDERDDGLLDGQGDDVGYAASDAIVEFVIPGTSISAQHTQAFLAEWPSMLLVRDAVATWGESVRVARRIDGGEGAALRHMVDEALTEVATFLAQYHLDTEVELTSLSWQGTAQYHYYEGVLLSELWRELLAHSDQTLKHPLLSAVVGLHLGNLYMAANQLPLAEQQFHHIVYVSGHVLADPLLEATAAFFSAVLCSQRAMHADAESQLLFAIRKCDEAEAEGDAFLAAPERPPSPPSPSRAQQPTEDGDGALAAGGGAAAASPRSGGSRRLPRSAVPAGYLQTIRAGCNLLLVDTLVSSYRHREGLERLEHALAYQYKDTLTDKLRATYYSGGLTSLDEIAAISAQVRSTLVYYLSSYRFTWDDDANVFTMEESLYTWVVPQSNEMRFVEVNVSKDFHTTIAELIEAARQGLHLDPEGPSLHPDTSSHGMITTLHRYAWMQPLQVLYSIFMDPIVDFIEVMSPLLRSGSSLVTVVPTGAVWTVPFHALISQKTGKFLVESMAVQLCFSATQAAFASLSAQRVQQRALHRDLIVVPGEEVVAAVEANLPLAFPLDTFRGQEEGKAILQLLQSTKDARAHAVAQSNPTATILTRSEHLVSDLQAIEAALPKARTVHFTTSTTMTPPLVMGATSPARSHVLVSSGAALCIPISHKAVGMLNARQISHMELFAELVVMSNSNVSYPYVMRCSTQDHVLNLVRGFFSGGSPCVLTGLWCTPDMKPSVLFTRFHEKLHDSGSRRVAARRTVRNDTLNANPLFSGENLCLDSIPLTGSGQAVDAEDGDEGSRHKAVCLARTIRDLFAEEPSLRYAPRQWAGYYCIGCDFI